MAQKGSEQSIHRVSGLDIDEDIELHRRLWRFQKIAWIILGVFLLCGMLGFVGKGLFSTARTSSTDKSVEVEYSRFTYNNSPDELTVKIAPGAIRDTTIRLAMSRDYLQDGHVRDISPQPERVELRSGELVYLFPLPATDSPASIVFHLEPQKFGFSSGWLSLSGGEKLSFRQLVYP